MTINIFQVPPDADFNFCGCGNGSGSGGSGSGGNGGQLPPGGTSGDVIYDGQARVIDICANVETIFQDAIASWINTVQNLGYIPGGAESVFPTDISNFVFDSIDELEDELYSAEYTLALKKWIVRRFDDPFPGFGTGFDGIVNLAVARADLIATMPRWPPLVAGAPFTNALTAWAYTADIQALNKRISDSAGTATYTGECAQLQEEAGREPYRPPASEDVIVIEDENYKYTRVLNDSVSEGADQDYTVAGENFVALLVRWRVYGGSGQVGTASLHSLTITHADGTSDAGDSTGSGSVPITNRGVSGVENFGATAAAAVPSYLSDFSDVTSAKEPSGATFPVPGAFTGTFSAETRFTYSADYQVWIVTDLDGSAEAVEA